MTQAIINKETAELLAAVQECKDEGCRLVQICSTKTQDGFELSYSFSRGYDFKVIRLQVAEDAEVPSISEVFSPAFLYENEMKDLFGIKITNITVDYKGSLYRTAIKTPFNPKSE